MKRIIYNLYLFLFLAGMTTSCTEERLAVWNHENSRLTISFSTSELDSRTVAGDDELNENKVSKIACYIYFGNDGNTNNANTVKMIDINTDDASRETMFTISFTDEELNGLANVDKLTLYAVANPPANILVTGTTNIPTIKKYSLVDTEFSMGTQPTSFVMDGQLLINVNKKANGSLEYTFPENDVLKLTRSAAKIMLHVHANNVVDNGITWEPQTNAMKVSFHNGVKYGYIDAGTNIYMPESETILDYFFSLDNSVVFNPEAKETPEGSNLEYIQQNSPFYSYPYQWTGVMDTAPYLMLVIPWKKADDSDNMNWVYYYYQIPINDLEGKCLERNHFYKIFVDVKALGSPVPTEKVTLEPSYVVVEWGGPLDIPVSLKQYRYLIAEQNEYVMNNVNTIDIPFITSHTCKLQNVKVMKDDISQENVISNQQLGTGIYSEQNTIYKNDNVTPCSEDKHKYLTITLNNNNSTIKVEHILDNDTNRSLEDPQKRLYDYQPITIEFEIVHSDDNQFIEKYTIIQYPMMYVEVEKNTGGNKRIDDRNVYSYYWNLWDGADESVKYDRGWVFVNENNIFIKDDYRMVRGCYNGDGPNNKNPNMYIITVTALDQGSPYILGDPRTGERLADTQLYTDWNTNDAAALYAVEEGKERNLTYYNPTREDGESVNIIAPKFRMASSYSKLLTSWFPIKDDMRKRCATYQEQGYPAGRWRLPTVAELAFVQNLSVEGKIPHLFSNENHYWTATGSYTYYLDEGYIRPNTTPDPTTGQIGGVVRPFYDDWYWGDDKCDPKVFTWGDKPL